MPGTYSSTEGGWVTDVPPPYLRFRKFVLDVGQMLERKMPGDQSVGSGGLGRRFFLTKFQPLEKVKMAEVTFIVMCISFWDVPQERGVPASFSQVKRV